VIVPQPQVEALDVFLVGDRGDVPFGAGDFGEALPAKFVQLAIFGN
jgi:hypothetical protein